MLRILNAVLIFTLTGGLVFGQPLKKNEKIRVNFGLSKFSEGQINIIPVSLEAETRANNLELPLTRFAAHLILGAEYERKLIENLSFLAGIEYHNELVSGASADEINEIEQGMNYEITFLSGNFSVVYYYPIFSLYLGEAHIFFGAGAELVYLNADLTYFYDRSPLILQVIEFKRNGYNWGWRMFGGLEIPFMPAVFLQLRLGYSSRIAENLSGKVKYNQAGPVNPQLFEINDKYNLTSTWFTVGLAYYF